MAFLCIDIFSVRPSRLNSWAVVYIRHTKEALKTPLKIRNCTWVDLGYNYNEGGSGSKSEIAAEGAIVKP